MLIYFFLLNYGGLDSEPQPDCTWSNSEFETWKLKRALHAPCI